MEPMFIRGINEKGEEVYLFIEEKKGIITVCEVNLFELKSGIIISTPAPSVGDLTGDERAKEIKKLSPRLVIKKVTIVRLLLT